MTGSEKITLEQKREIQKLHKERGVSISEISRHFEISTSRVKKILEETLPSSEEESKMSDSGAYKMKMMTISRVIYRGSSVELPRKIQIPRGDSDTELTSYHAISEVVRQWKKDLTELDNLKKNLIYIEGGTTRNDSIIK